MADAATFNGTRAVGYLGLMYVIIAGSFVDSLLCCDMRRLMLDSIVAKHVVLLLGAIFWVAESQSDGKFGSLLAEALFVYALFVLSTKSTRWFIMPVLLLTVTDQLLRLYVTSEAAAAARAAPGAARDGARASAARRARFVVQGACVTVILAGFISYLAKQMAEQGDEFSFGTFLLGTAKCRE